MEISEHEYWKSAYKSAEALLSLLSVFEKRSVKGVDKAVESLRGIVAGGDDFDKLKERTQAPPQHIASPPSPPSPRQQQQQQQQQQQSHQAGKRPWYNYSNYDMEDDWQQMSAYHIEVPLSNHKAAICMLVSNEEQLDEAIQEIRNAEYIAIDCEFQSIKKSLPELKLLQIGVSSTKGFAIQVDSVGFDVLSAKLKPILEDDEVNIVGWSYRPDAMAIESYFKSIEQAPVLDLQAKLMPIAVETMNLEAAMVKFADQWDGLEAFKKAKHYSDGFFYNNDDCIWTKIPLPPKALVYSIFDVLSVHALHQYTKQYPSEEKFYWPYTLAKQSEKALYRFHQQRAQGIASPANLSSPRNGKTPATPKTHWNTNYKSTSPTYRQRYSNKRREDSKEEEYLACLSSQPKTDDGYDDNDTRYQKDIQKAIILSVKESARKEYQSYGGESSASGASFSGQQQEDNVIVDDDDRLNNNWRFSGNTTTTKTSIAEEVNYKSWGDFDPTSQPFFGGQPFANPNVSNAGAVTESTNSDYGPPDVKASVPEPKPSSAATASVPPAISAPVPVRQPMPPPTVATPNFNQQKTHKSLQHQFSRPPTQNVYQSKSHSYQATPSPAQPYHSNQYQQQPPPQQQQAHHLPKPVPYSPRNNFDATRSHRKPFTNVARSSQAPAPSHSAPPVVTPTKSTSSSGKLPATATATTTTTTTTTNTNTNTNTNTTVAGFGSKPSKEKYASEFQSRVAAGDQGGSFTWSQDAAGGVGAASWTIFANTTGEKWKSGIDSELTDLEREEAKRKAAAAAGSISPVKKEAIKFNTTASVIAGHRAQEPVDEDGVDNWSKEEERPDTMEMKMGQIPIRKHFSGPRVMGPDIADSDSDDDDDDDDDDDENPYEFFGAGGSRRLSEKDAIIDRVGLKMKLPSEPEVARHHRAVDALETFVDAIYPNSFGQDQELAMLTLESLEQLDMIIVPDQPFTVTVCFHTVESKSKQFVFKALQLYLSTGESYTCVLEKACTIQNRSKFKSTVFGRLLSDPSIKRISWCPDFIMESFVEILGFEMGPTVDLGFKVMENDTAMSFALAVEKYLKDWPDVIKYFECKQQYDSWIHMSNKKFGGSCWERPKVPLEVLEFCALQGLTAYALYQKTLELGFGDDEEYIYPNDDDDDDDE
ncbi:uncharacterized protein ATC70_005701 [Mucor velutinosus]|uniref:3'-5' exonuclease domain-containing protein n=1 Tax=Mucor velutinosus TaxID=708070 RepID=A0AAN7HZK7_9FUNG|nr:hypothetical protein ATC70_005701 [Mucor velutinosus]